MDYKIHIPDGKLTNRCVNNMFEENVEFILLFKNYGSQSITGQFEVEFTLSHKFKISNVGFTNFTINEIHQNLRETTGLVGINLPPSVNGTPSLQEVKIVAKFDPQSYSNSNIVTEPLSKNTLIVMKVKDNSGFCGNNVGDEVFHFGYLPGENLHGGNNDLVFYYKRYDRVRNQVNSSDFSGDFNAYNIYLEPDAVLNINDASFDGLYNNSLDFFTMDKSSKIIFEDINQPHELSKINFEGCGEYMHNGLELADGAEIIMDEVLVKDAYRGLTIRDETDISITNSQFIDNHTGIYSSSNGTTDIEFHDFYNNVFEEDEGLDRDPNNGNSGLSPALSVYMDRNNGFIDLSSTDELQPNYYSDYTKGMLLKNTYYNADNNVINRATKGFEIRSGFLYSKNNVINNTETGYHLRSSGIWARDNTMNTNKYGMDILSSRGKSVYTKNNTINSDKYGIWQVNIPTSYHLNNAINIVSNGQNHFGLNSFYSNSMYAHGNTFDIDQGEAAIIVNQGFGNLITGGNIINLNDSQYGTSGIRLLNTTSTDIHDNDILGPGTGGSFSNSRGIRSLYSTQSNMNCNLIQDVEKGLWFNGMNDESYYRDNLFHNNSVGLQLSFEPAEMNTESITGVQVNHGNRWTGPATFAQSFNNDEFSDLTSQVQYNFGPNGTVTTRKPVTVQTYSGALWFDNVSGNTFSCVSSPVPGGTTPPVYDDEILYLQKIVETDSLSKEEEWKIKYAILKGIEKKSISSWTSTESTFYNDHNGDIVQSIAIIKNDIDEILTQDSTVIINNEILQDHFDQYNLGVTHYKDSIKIQGAKLSEILENAELSNINAATLILSDLNNLTTASGIETHYKDAYALYMNGVINGFDQYDSLQINSLENLADLCMYRYPEAVTIARGILHINGSYTWDDSDGCNAPIFVRSVKEDAEREVLSFYPNPVNRLLHLGSTVGNYSIRNMDGKLMMTAEKVSTIDVSGWPTGVYIIYDDVSKQHGKFIKI